MAVEKMMPTPEDITAQLAEMGVGEPVAEVKAAAPKIEEQVKEDTPKAQESKYSDVEQDAIAKGWKPDGPKSAEEFLRAEPLYEELKARGKEIKELKTTLDELKGYMTKQQELGYKKALRELEEARRDAIRLGEVEQVESLDLQIQDQRNEFNTVVTKEAQAEVAAFAERHKDWIHDPSYEAQEIREFVKRRDNELVSFNLPPAKHLATIEQDMMKKFPNRFGPITRDKPSTQAVESDGSLVVGTKKKKVTFSDLNEQQKTCARQFEKRGIMTRDAYIQSLIDLGEV